MKKFFTIGLVMLMTFVAVGCGKSEPTEVPKEPTSEATEEAVETNVTVSGNTFKLTEVHENGEKHDTGDWGKDLTFNQDGSFLLKGVDEEAIDFTGTYTEDDNFVYMTYDMDGYSWEEKMTKDGKTIYIEKDLPEFDENGETGKTIKNKSVYTLVE